MPPAHIFTAIGYEAELTVIIGKGGKSGKSGKSGKGDKGGKGGKADKCIAAKGAMAHVWGYTIVNNITACGWQSRRQQWHMGKSFNTFCPTGPYLVSADELGDTNTMVRCYGVGALENPLR